MRTNLALLNIGHNLPRTLVALAGIGVAIVLMFMQLGFRGAVENTATTLYDRMEFDLLVRSPGYLHFVEPGAIDAALLDELRSLDSVREVRVLQVGLAGWLSPDQQRLRGLMVLGIDPRQPPFQAAALPVDWWLISFSYAGMIRIRFEGYISAGSTRTRRPQLLKCGS